MNNNTYPIILAHGIARFDFLTNAFLKRINLSLWERSLALSRLHYFKGIVPYLQQHGFEVYATQVSFAAGLQVRAQDLGQEVSRVLADSGHKKVHIIGHSMGGLDTRTMIVQEGMAPQVASATSIGSPHLGTSFANWGLAHGGHDLIQRIGEVVDLGGFEDITLEAMASFNEHMRHEEATNDVIYQTYAASQELDSVFTPIQESWKIIHEAEGANDGLVSVRSQRWTPELVSDDGRTKAVRQRDFPVPADHLNQIGWWDVRELRRMQWWRSGLWQAKEDYEASVRQVYLKIAQELVELDC